MDQLGLSMAEPPKPSDIPNVFGLNEPQHMLSKLYFEIMKLMDSLSAWDKEQGVSRTPFHCLQCRRNGVAHN